MRRRGSSAPLLATGPRGSGQFKEISWDEALEPCHRLARRRCASSDPKKLAFFTGRDQSQSLTGFWAQQFGTPNYAAHGGFCSVNMAAGGIMTIGGAFWEFGAPDWDRTKLFVMFGVAEDHDSNPIKIGISKLKKRGARFVSVNPVRTGYSAVADNWIGIRPGTDGLLILSVVHELLKARKIDVDYIVRYSNATWLVVDAPGTAEHGLFARDGEGRVQIFETVTEHVGSARHQGGAASTFRPRRTAGRPLCRAGFPASGRKIPRSAIRARGGRAGDRRFRRCHPRARRRDRPRRLRRGDQHRPAVDRHERRAP